MADETVVAVLVLPVPSIIPVPVAHLGLFTSTIHASSLAPLAVAYTAEWDDHHQMNS